MTTSTPERTTPEGTAPERVRPETAQALSNTVVRVGKLITVLRHHSPRQHPAVDPSHYPVLYCVSAEPRRVSAVADTIHSDVSTVSRQVSHLVQHGLLEKIGDPEDRRAQLLSVSPAGREVLEKLVRGRGEWFERLLASWSDDDARAFLQYLSRFGDDLETFKTQLVTTNPADATALATELPTTPPTPNTTALEPGARA